MNVLTAMASSITLSIGGVDFVLQPVGNKETSSKTALQIDKLSDEGATVHLNNFSGVLRVVRNDNGLSRAGTDLLDSQNDRPGVGSQLDDSSLANEVENVPSPQGSPEKDDVLGNEQPDQPKGQTKLNFRRTRQQQSETSGSQKDSSPSKRKYEDQDSLVVEKKMKPQMKAIEGFDPILHDKSEAVADGKLAADLHDKSDIFGDLQEQKNPSLGQTMPSQDNESYALSALSADSSIGKLIPASKTNAKEVVPCARWGQTMTMIDHRRLVVYGGHTMKGSSPETLADLYIYDILDKVRAL